MHILIANISAKQFVSYDDKHITGDVEVSCKRYIFMFITFFFSIRSSLPIQNMHTVIQDVALFDADEELIETGVGEIASKGDKNKKSKKSKESKSKDSKKSKKSSKSKSSRSSRSSRSSSSSSSSSGSGSGSFDSQDCRW